MSTDHARALRQALHFTKDDLTLNREGRLSEQQADRLADGVRTQRRNLYLFATALALAGSVVYFEGPQGLSVIVFLMAAAGYLAGTFLVKPGADLRAQKCHVVEGPIKLVRRTRGHGKGSVRFKLWVNPKTQAIKGTSQQVTTPGKKFRVSERAWKAFDEDISYRIYYTDKKVAAAEPQ